MNSKSLSVTLEQGLAEIPILDMHSHLVGGKMAARGLHDVLLYHMLVSELYAAGCPNGARLTQYPGWPDEKEAHRRIEEALPYLPLIRNTNLFWSLKVILRDLYGWKEPITTHNWRKLDAIIREKAEDATWPGQILDRLKIERTVTELARRQKGTDDDRLQYSLEWAFFTRCQWGEFDTALYELERCWGKPPGSPTPIGGGKRPAPDRTIQTLADVHSAMNSYIETIPYDQIVTVANHISTDIDYSLVSDSQMEAALLRRSSAGPAERDIYASYINELFLVGLEKRSRKITFQFSLAAEPLPFETASRVSQRTIAQLAEIISRHPQVPFQCFLSSRHANQSLCILGRELPNFSLTGYWWHNFFPDVIRQIMAERLEMLPVNKQIGFFSDAYCVEWAYAKTVLVRELFAEVLAQKIGWGQYTTDEALSIARSIFYETPQTLLGMVPRKSKTSPKKSHA